MQVWEVFCLKSYLQAITNTSNFLEKTLCVKCNLTKDRLQSASNTSQSSTKAIVSHQYHRASVANQEQLGHWNNGGSHSSIQHLSINWIQILCTAEKTNLECKWGERLSRSCFKQLQKLFQDRNDDAISNQIAACKTAYDLYSKEEGAWQITETVTLNYSVCW